jgi:hypothetical protein
MTVPPQSVSDETYPQLFTRKYDEFTLGNDTVTA